MFFIVPVTDSPSNPTPMGIIPYRTSTVDVTSSTIYLVNYIFFVSAIPDGTNLTFSITVTPSIYFPNITINSTLPDVSKPRVLV